MWSSLHGGAVIAPWRGVGAGVGGIETTIGVNAVGFEESVQEYDIF